MPLDSNIIEGISLGSNSLYIVAIDPSSSPGITAGIGSLSFYNDGVNITLYIKSGSGDTEWKKLAKTNDIIGEDKHTAFVSTVNGISLTDAVYTAKSTVQRSAQSKFPPTTTFKFGVVAKRSLGAGTFFVRLYDVTNASELGVIEFTESSFTYKEATFTYPSGAFMAEVQVKADLLTTGILSEAVILSQWG